MFVGSFFVHSTEGSDDCFVEGLHLDDPFHDLRVVDLRIGDHPDEEGPLVPQGLLRLLVQLLEDVSLLLLLLVLVSLAAELVVALKNRNKFF